MHHSQIELQLFADAVPHAPPNAPAPMVQEQETKYEGWTNSATYLASLYLSNCPASHKAIYAMVGEDGTIPVRKLSRQFKVERGNEERSGVADHTIYLDAWADGEVNWDEIAWNWTEDLRRDMAPDRPSNRLIALLDGLTVDGNVVRLPRQMDRCDYLVVDKALRALGGKWNKGRGGHVFTVDPADAIDALITTGTYERPDNFGFFPTPDALADEVVALARLEPGMKVLEPQAGTAQLLERAAAIVGVENVIAVELQPHLAAALGEAGYRCIEGDFLSASGLEPESFDGIVMNPPFARQSDIDHVMYAWTLLKPGRRMVSIMAASVSFRSNRKTESFRAFVSEHGTIRQNAAGAFKSSGTDVNTVTVILDKPSSLS